MNQLLITSKTSAPPALNAILAQLERVPNLPQTLKQSWLNLEPSKFNLSKALQCVESTQNWAVFVPSTIEKAMEAQSPTIGAMKKYMGDAVTAEVLTEIIMASLTVLNLEKSVSPQQMKYTAILLMQENPLMKLSDWQTCLKMGVMGQYGEKDAQIYGRIDIYTLSTWQRLYWEHRLQIGEMKAKIQRNTSEAEGKSYAPPPEVLKAIRERIEKLDRPKKHLTPDQALIDFWRSEWEAMPEPRPDFEGYKLLKIKNTEKWV